MMAFDFLNNPTDCAHVPLEERMQYICGKPCDLPQMLKGDEGRLKHVLISLLDNAFKHTD